MMRERIVAALLLVAIALGAWGISASTEWVEEETRRPARGEARENPVYAFEQLLRKLDMTVERHQALDRMPPQHARLLLLSRDWELVPERAEQLRQWVQRGGHLVLLHASTWNETRLASWVPVATVDVSQQVRERNKARQAAKAAKAAKATSAPDAEYAAEDDDLVSMPPVFDAVDTLASCRSFGSNQRLAPKAGQRASWSLAQEFGAQALRVPSGRGSVTVLNVHLGAITGVEPLACDNPLLLAAALQAERGATAWIYLNETREALLPWLWHQGWIAIAIGLLALAATLWRGAMRFGPRLAAPPRLRRSISEQVRGLGAYLHREGREALLQAQQRALDEAAARHLRGYARLTLSERARAIEAATGLAHTELSAALSARVCTRAQLPQLLHCLEAARRRLIAGGAAAASPTHDRRLSP